ncbi:Ig-like domain-containing protein, partial [Massilia varians]|uniref:Ig-like domain-containing protein n=1 Tax=Massilia varians TaxID=457921 RepID=UPI00255568D1
MTTEATLLSFPGNSDGDMPMPGMGTNYTNATHFGLDPNLIKTGYSNATYNTTTGLIDIPVTAGQGTIGFGSYVPEDYTGPGAIYLYAVIIKDSQGQVLVNEEFNNWTGNLPSTAMENRANFVGDNGRVWSVYTNTNDIYSGHGGAFSQRVEGTDKGIVYPADGAGPFKVLISTDLPISAGVTSISVDLRWGYSIDNWGSSARTFSLGFQNQQVSAENLFSFLGPAPSDTTAPTLAISSNVTSLKIGETATITFTFSEDPGTSFNADDIVVTGGTLGALSGSGTVRTATCTPTAGTNGGEAGISVAAGSSADAAGTPGGAGSSPALVFDTKAPTVAISSNVTALKIGETAAITFTFSE